MSHIATVALRIKELSLLAEVCSDLNIPCSLKTTEIALYSARVQAAASFRLPGWRYPVAVLKDGTIQYDTFDGHWGAPVELHRVLQAYAERITLRHACRMGAAVFREERPDGTLLLRLRV